MDDCLSRNDAVGERVAATPSSREKAGSPFSLADGLSRQGRRNYAHCRINF